MNCKKKFQRIKKNKGLAIGLFAILLFAAVAFQYLASPLSGTPEESIIVKIVDTVADEINIFRTASPKNEFITEYDFVLSTADLRYFNEAGLKSVELGYRDESASNYRDVELTHQGKEWTVGMALRGDFVTHFIGDKKSFKIKSDRGNFIGSRRRLDFSLPYVRNYFVPIFGKYLAERLGLPSPGFEIAAVKFNGVPQGLYLVQDGIDQYFLEKNGQPGRVIVEYRDNWLEDHPFVGLDSLDWNVTPREELDYSS